MKRYLCLLILVLSIFTPLKSVLGNDEYWVHTYIDKYAPSPGDTIIITSEVFWKGIRVEEDFVLNIRIYEVNEASLDDSMTKVSSGKYIFTFTIPISFENSILSTRVRVYDNDILIQSTYSYFETNVEVDEPVITYQPVSRSYLEAVIPGFHGYLYLHLPTESMKNCYSVDCSCGNLNRFLEYFHQISVWLFLLRYST